MDPHKDAFTAAVFALTAALWFIIRLAAALLTVGGLTWAAGAMGTEIAGALILVVAAFAFTFAPRQAPATDWAGRTACDRGEVDQFGWKNRPPTD